MARDKSTYNSKGLANLYGRAKHWKKKGLPPKDSCAICFEKLQEIGVIHYCVVCKAVYTSQASGLLKYIGRKL